MSQCSYNALSSALVELEGPVEDFSDRNSFEKRTFLNPTNQSGMGAYYGWGPWMSFAVNSGNLPWDGKPVTDIVTKRFALRPAADPMPDGDEMVVMYSPGERQTLRDKLRGELRDGPVILWTPYGAVMGRNWHHVRHIDDLTDRVLFSRHMTHSVTLFLRDEDMVLVTDCSVRDGVFRTDLDTIVATSSAMAGMVRLNRAGKNSLLQNGFKGINEDQYNVVLVKKAAPAISSRQIQSAIAASPPTLAAPLRDALCRAGDRADAWATMISAAPREQRAGIAFIVATLVPRDLDTLDPARIRSEIAMAYTACQSHPWGKQTPDEIFLSAVLPLTNLSESRDPWRAELAARCEPIVAGCHSAGEAAVALNDHLFSLLNVHYHPTKRPKPDQSPAESIAATYASCTGLSILLVDACRSVGIAARVVGTPHWFTGKGDSDGNHAGNHTWVEIWDGQWHVLGAGEPGPLDKTWFLGNASKQFYPADSEPLFRIYAAWPGSMQTYFHMAWNLKATYISALDITAAYADRREVLVKVASPSHVTLRQQGRLVADLDIDAQSTLWLSLGQTYEATMRTANRSITQVVTVPVNNRKPELSLRSDL